jgi:hypothetical protein
MPKVNKQYITPMWLEIKEYYEKNTNKNPKYGENFEIGGKLDEMTREFVDKIGVLTREFGWECTIEDVHMNLWKERIWSLIENAGLLPEIAWRDDLAKDEELAAKKAAEEAEYQDEFDIDEDYEPTDEELIKNLNI